MNIARSLSLFALPLLLVACAGGAEEGDSVGYTEMSESEAAAQKEAAEADKKMDLARDDVERLLALDPARAEGWLERGILRQLQGDLRGARDDLMRAIAKAEDPAVVDAARRRLEMVDVTGR